MVPGNLKIIFRRSYFHPRLAPPLGYPHPRPGFLARSRFPGTFVSARTSHQQEPVQGRLDFQTLVDQFYGPLYRFAMSLTRVEADAADPVQETFLTWATKGHQLHDLSKVKSWLFSTLHRSFLQSQRRLARFPHLEEIPADPGEWHVNVRSAGALSATLRDLWADAQLFRRLATLANDAPLPQRSPDELLWRGARRAEFTALCEELGQPRLAERPHLWRD